MPIVGWNRQKLQSRTAVDTTDVTLAEMLAEARRELAMRRRLYPRWVEDGRMKAHHAERQIAVMAAIVAELDEREMAAANEPETLL